MDNYVDERDYKLIENDKYTFFVLGKIMGGECRVLLTDHEKMIICHSNNPFPVWIWSSDNITEKEMDKAYQIVSAHFPFDEGYTFNIKYELAKYFIQRAMSDDINLSIKINMFAYDCPNPVEPKDKTDGKVHPCTLDDIEELTEIYDLFQKETGIDRQSYEQNRANAEYSVENKNIFFWEDVNGKHVASCTYRPNGKGDMASIGLVYTREEARRMHYAENLVYQITKKAKGEGYMPMLYTNADYVASNACYEKIGYKLRGKLCTIGV